MINDKYMFDLGGNTARYKHDCKNCTYLGQFNEYDLYFCLQGGKIPTVIARFSSEGPDYYSGITSNITELTEAKCRAITRGLLISSKYIAVYLQNCYK